MALWKSKPRRVVIERPAGGSKRWQLGSTGGALRSVRVVDIHRETPSAVTVLVEPEDGRRIVFRAGQYLTHCFTVDGQVVKRAYSLSAAEGGALAFTVKALADGVASRHVSQRLSVGDRYTIAGPSGEFLLDPASRNGLAFLAAGSGITPVISLMETALALDPGRTLRLVYASRAQNEIIFCDRLEAFARRHPSVEIIHVLSRPHSGWSGESGRLTGERAAALLGTGDNDYYLCGPLPLMDATETALRLRGVPAAQIRRERFLAAPQASMGRPTAPQEIVFKRSNRSVQQQVGETILEAGLREGVELPFSCTVGGCASCKIHVVEGQVALNEPNCLAADERAQGYTLACSAYAASRIVVDF